MKPHDKLFAWKKESALDRIHACKVMLHLHGFMTDPESKRVNDRIVKWVEKHQSKKEGK